MLLAHHGESEAIGQTNSGIAMGVVGCDSVDLRAARARRARRAKTYIDNVWPTMVQPICSNIPYTPVGRRTLVHRGQGYEWPGRKVVQKVVDMT